MICMDGHTTQVAYGAACGRVDDTVIRQRHHMDADASSHNVSFDRMARSSLRRCPNLPIVTVFQRASCFDISGPHSDRHTVREGPSTPSHH